MQNKHIKVYHDARRIYGRFSIMPSLNCPLCFSRMKGSAASVCVRFAACARVFT